MTQPHASLELPARSAHWRRLPVAEKESQRERVFGLVYRQMVTLVGRSEDLEDLVQTAAEQALRSLDRFDDRSELSTWTYRICHNTYLKQLRWYRRWFNRFRFWEDTERFEPRDHRPNPGQSFDHDEQVSRLWAAIARVSPKRRVAVVLHDLEGLAVEQIADIVACSPLTVRSRLRDGRKMLARELAMAWGCVPAQTNAACRGTALGSEGSSVPEDACNGVAIEVEPSGSVDLPCEYPVPSIPYVSLDPNNVQIVFTPAAGAATGLPHLAGAADCATSDHGGFYYVDNADPQTIRLCPCSCAAIQGSDIISVTWGCPRPL